MFLKLSHLYSSQTFTIITNQIFIPTLFINLSIIYIIENENSVGILPIFFFNYTYAL